MSYQDVIKEQRASVKEAYKRVQNAYKKVEQGFENGSIKNWKDFEKEAEEFVNAFNDMLKVGYSVSKKVFYYYERKQYEYNGKMHDLVSKYDL